MVVTFTVQKKMPKLDTKEYNIFICNNLCTIVSKNKENYNNKLLSSVYLPTYITFKNNKKNIFF